MISIPCPGCGESVELFDSAEAAQYLGFSLSSLKYHVHLADNLVPYKVGHSFLFTKAQLDEFAANRRPPGRPKSKED